MGAAGGCGHGSEKVLFALGLGSPEVVVFKVSSSGELSDASSAASTGANPDAMVIDPQFRFAYVADSSNGVGSGAISQYTLKASSGALSVATLPAVNGVSGPTLPVPAGVNPVVLASDAKGTLIFAANKGSNNISVYTIDQDTGALTPLGCVEGQSCTTQTFFATAAGPSALASTGSSLFVANAGAAELSTFTFDSSGKLSGGTAIAAGLNPVAMDMNSSGNFLFVAGSDHVASFSIGSSGGLTPKSSLPVAAGTTPVAIRLHPQGKFLYTANQGSNNNVSLFTVDSSGTLAAGGTFATGNGPSAVEIDASGSFLFVANGAANTISVFKIDASTGKLTEVTGSPFPSVATSPVALKSLN